MDGLRDPVGGKSPEIYWRRRIVAAIGVVLVIVVIYFLASSPGGKTTDAKGATTPPPATSADPSADPSAQPSGDVSRACTAADVTLTVTPNPFEFAAGALPVFDVAIKNATAPCLLDTASTDTSLVIWSGGESNKDIYFSSAYCPDDGTITSRQLLLQAGAEEPFSLTWSRQRKGEGCSTGNAPGEGFYWAQVTIQGIASEPAQFQQNN